MTDALTKLIEENKERPIEEAKEKTPYLVKTKEHEWFEAYLDGNWDAPDPRGGGGYPIYGEVTHFRPLPDDRLALVAECLDDGYQTIIKHFPDAEVLVNKIRQKATAIAEGKDKTDEARNG